MDAATHEGIRTPGIIRAVREARLDDLGTWDAVADAAGGGPVPGLAAALEARLDGPEAPPAPIRLRILLSLARQGRRVEVGAADPRTAKTDPLAWLDLAVATEPDAEARAALYAEAARDGTLEPRDLASRLADVRSAAHDGLARWMGELVEAFPFARRPSATAVLVAAFGVMPADAE